MLLFGVIESKLAQPRNFLGAEAFLKDSAWRSIAMDLLGVSMPQSLVLLSFSSAAIRSAESHTFPETCLFREL